VLAEFMSPESLVLFPFGGAVESRPMADLLPLGFELRVSN
jgi:hypothetical protein